MKLTILFLFLSSACFSQTSFTVREDGEKTIVVQSNTTEVAITSVELDKQITELDEKIKLMTEQKNIFLDLYRKIKAIEEKNAKPEAQKESPKN